VYDRRSDDPSVTPILDYPGNRTLVAAATKVERRLGLHSMLQVHSFGLPAHASFRKANVAHYHIVHDGFFSIAALPLLARLKPSVWTWHDPWIMTGHCIYPMDCEGWRTGCGGCPDLLRTFQMEFDNTRRAFAIKRRIVQATPMHIVVASKWMEGMANASPMGRNARLHQIPFGVDLKRFAPRDPAAARAALGVRPGNVVIAVRGQASSYKGVPELAEALEQIKAPLTLVSLSDSGSFNRFIGRHQIIALDWSDDEDRLIEAYTAADLFAMPSTAEAFGMMAIEAMACGKPVVCFEGTSLPEITFAPECGLAVPMRDVRALARAVEHLVTNREDRIARGQLARELAERHYSAELYADRLATLYRMVAGREALDVSSVA
jgi:glycosyltransferase involved in cell wall biosynthesis